MRHLGIVAGAALIAFAPGVASAQMGAPTGAPMQAGSWGQGGWQPGGSAAPSFEPGAPGFAPQGYGYRGHAMDARRDYKHLSRGKRVPDAYMDPHYAVADWNDWGFSPPAPGTHWVRYYDDGLLVDGRGRIVDTRYGIDWDRGHGSMRGPRGGFGPHGFAGGPGGYPGGFAGGPGYPGHGTSTYRAGPNTTVTTTVVPTPPPMIVGGPAYGYGGGYYGGGAQIVSVTPGVAVTTTTTTTDYETVYKSVAVKQRAWRRPIRHYHPRCAHTTSCPVLGS